MVEAGENLLSFLTLSGQDQNTKDQDVMKSTFSDKIQQWVGVSLPAIIYVSVIASIYLLIRYVISSMNRKNIACKSTIDPKSVGVNVVKTGLARKLSSSKVLQCQCNMAARREHLLAGGEHVSGRLKLEEVLRAKHQQVALTSSSLKSRSDDDHFLSVGAPNLGHHLHVMTEEKNRIGHDDWPHGGQDRTEMGGSDIESPTFMQEPSHILDSEVQVNPSPAQSKDSSRTAKVFSGQRLYTLLTAEEATVALLQGDFRSGAGVTRAEKKTHQDPRESENIEECIASNNSSGDLLRQNAGTACRNRKNKNRRLRNSNQATGLTKPIACPSSELEDISVIPHAVHSHLNLTGDVLLSPEVLLMSENTSLHHPVSIAVRKRRGASSKKLPTKCLPERWGDGVARLYHPGSVGERQHSACASEHKPNGATSVVHNLSIDQEVCRTEHGQSPDVKTRHWLDELRITHSMNHQLKHGGVTYPATYRKDLRNLSSDFIEVSEHFYRQKRPPCVAEDRYGPREYCRRTDIMSHLHKPTRGNSKLDAPRQSKEMDCGGHSRSQSVGTHLRPINHQDRHQIDVNKKVQINKRSPVVLRPVITSDGRFPSSIKRGFRRRATNRKMSPLHLYGPLTRLWKENPTVAKNFSSNMNPASTESSKPSPNHGDYFSNGQGNIIRQSSCACPIKHKRHWPFCHGSSPGGDECTFSRVHSGALDEVRVAPNTTRWNVSPLNNASADWSCLTANNCVSRRGQPLHDAGNGSVARECPIRTAADGRRKSSPRAGKVYYFHYDSDNESCDVDLGISAEGCIVRDDDDDDDDILSIKVNPGDSDGHLTSHPSFTNERHTSGCGTRPLVRFSDRRKSSDSIPDTFNDHKPRAPKEVPFREVPPNNKFNYSFSLHECSDSVFSDEVRQINVPGSDSQCGVRKSRIPVPSRLANFSNSRIECDRKLPPKPRNKISKSADKGRMLQTSSYGLHRESNELLKRATPISSELSICRIDSTNSLDASGASRNTFGRMLQTNLNVYETKRIESNRHYERSRGRFEERKLECVHGSFSVNPDLTDLEDERKTPNLYKRGGVRKNMNADSKNKRTHVSGGLENRRPCATSRRNLPVRDTSDDRKVFTSQKQPRSASMQSFTRRGGGENLQDFKLKERRNIIGNVNSKHQIITATNREKVPSPVVANRLSHREGSIDEPGDNYGRADARRAKKRKNEDDHQSPKLGNAGRKISQGSTQCMLNFPLPQHSPHSCYGRPLATSGKRTPQQMISQPPTSPSPKPKKTFSKPLPLGSFRAAKTSSVNVLSTTNLTSKSSMHSDVCAEDYFPITCVTYRDYYSMSDRTSRTTSPNTSFQRRSSQCKKTWPVIPLSETSTADIVSPPPNKSYPKRPSTYNSGQDMGSKHAAVANKIQPKDEARDLRKNMNQFSHSPGHSPSMRYCQEAPDARCRVTKSTVDCGKVFMVQSPPRVPEESRSELNSDVGDKGKPFIKPEDASVILESLKETLLYRRSNSKRLNREYVAREASFSKFANSETESDLHNEEKGISTKQVRMIASQAHEAFKRVPIPCFENSSPKISSSDIRLAMTLPHASDIPVSKRPQERKSSADSDSPAKKTKAQNYRLGDRSRKKSNTPTPPRKFLQVKCETKGTGTRRIPSVGRNSVRDPWDPRVRGDGHNKTEDPKRKPDTTTLTCRKLSPKEEAHERAVPICGETGQSVGGKSLVLTESSTARHLLGNVDELREKYLKEMLSKDIYQQLPVDISPAGYRKSIIDHYQFEMMSMKGQFVPRVGDSTNVIMKPALAKTNHTSCAPGRCADARVQVNSSLTAGSKGNNKVEKKVFAKNVCMRSSADKLSRLKGDETVSTIAPQPAKNDSMKSAIEDEDGKLFSAGDITWPADSASAEQKEEGKAHCGILEQCGVTELHYDKSTHGYRLVNDVSSLSRDEARFVGERDCFPTAARPSELGGKPGSDENLDSFIGAICNQAKYYLAQTDRVSGEYENSIEEDDQQITLPSHNNEVVMMNEKSASELFSANTEHSQCNDVKKSERFQTDLRDEISVSVYEGEAHPSNMGDEDTLDAHTKDNPDNERVCNLLSSHNKAFDQLLIKTKTQEPDIYNVSRVDAKRSTFSDLLMRTRSSQPVMGPVNNTQRRFETTKWIDLKNNCQRNEQATKENVDGQQVGSCLEKSKNVSPPRKQEVTLKPESRRHPSRENLPSDLDTHRRNLRKSGFRGCANKGYVTSAMQYSKKKSEIQSKFVGQCQKLTESTPVLEKNNSANFRRSMIRDIQDQTRRCNDCFQFRKLQLDCARNDLKNASAYRKIIQASQCQMTNQNQTSLLTGEHCGTKSSPWSQRNNYNLNHKDQTSSYTCDHVSLDRSDTSARHLQSMNARDARESAPGQSATQEVSSEQCDGQQNNGEATSRSDLSGCAQVSFDWYKPSATSHLRRGPAAEHTSQNTDSSGYSVNPCTQQAITSHNDVNVAAVDASGHGIKDDHRRMDSGFGQTIHTSTAQYLHVPHEHDRMFHKQYRHTRTEHHSRDEGDEDGSGCVYNDQISECRGDDRFDGRAGRRMETRATHRQKLGQENAFTIYHSLLKSYNQVNQAMHNNWLLQNSTQCQDGHAPIV